MILLLPGIGVLVNGAAAAVAYRRGLVDVGGAVAGAAVGSVIFGFGGALCWLVLGAFFVSSAVVGAIGRKEKRWLVAIHEKGDRRDFLQVLANGGAGAVASIVLFLTHRPAWALSFAVSFAAANADTWASEIGVLSHALPVSLATFKRMPRGLSGGVTLLGLAASLAGALLIGITFALVNAFEGLVPSGAVRVGLAVASGGVLGSLIDSLLGATVQRRYASASDASLLTERRFDADGSSNPAVGGLRFVTNDVVNLASVGAVTALAALLWPLLFRQS